MGRTKLEKTPAADSSSSSILIISKLDQIKQNLDEILSKQKNENNILQEIKQLKEIVCSQNKVIVDLISELNVIVKTNIVPGMNSTKYLDQFPIESEAELEDMESEISDDTKDAIVATIKNIVGRDKIKKKITSIFGKQLLFEFNVDGRSGKKRLLGYPKLMNLIHKSVYKEEMMSKDGFLKEMRVAIRLFKNRCYKDDHDKKHRKADDAFFNEGENNDFSKSNSGCLNQNEHILSLNEL